MGPLFVDLGTCCRGPVEFDIVHAPEGTSEHYPLADQDLLMECRIVMLAMITTWRWNRDDQLPNGRCSAGSGSARCEQRSIATDWILRLDRWTKSHRDPPR